MKETHCKPQLQLQINLITTLYLISTIVKKLRQLIAFLREINKKIIVVIIYFKAPG